jgi:ribonucleoside-triphosphate reductase
MTHRKDGARFAAQSAWRAFLFKKIERGGIKMRSITEITKDLDQARDELAHTEGGPAEVYSRIVGYYRSVRNWNKGKKEEYGERKLFQVSEADIEDASRSAEEDAGVGTGAESACAESEPAYMEEVPTVAAIARETGVARSKPAGAKSSPRLLLFVRPACPACPSAKAAAGKLGIPVDTLNADTEDGLAEASRRNVLSTPTAILVAPDGKEITRALDSAGIAALEDLIAG